MPSSAAARLSNINLLVQDTATSQRFYQEVFGLIADERRSAAPSMLILQGPGCTLGLKDRATEEADKVSGPGDVELGFETADLDAVYRALGDWDVKRTPIQTLGFGRTFDAQDPDGHHLVVYTLSAENR